MNALDDVYWLEDSRSRQLFGKDFAAWTAARQSLPTSKNSLESLKAELWSKVVKDSRHQDAWTWGMSSTDYKTIHFKPISSLVTFLTKTLCLRLNTNFPIRRNAGSIRISGGSGDSCRYDSARPGSRSKTFFVAVCHWQISITS